MGWDTFWAIFSETHPVTLLRRRDPVKRNYNSEDGTDWSLKLAHKGGKIF
jgi:hypothetical protein